MAMVQADAEKEITDRDLIGIIHRVRRGQTPSPVGSGPGAATVR
jgi:hypothetical protein